LAYRPEKKHDSIAGIGHINKGSAWDSHLREMGEIEIELEIIFDQPVSRNQLVEVAPVVNYAPGTHFGLFNLIEAEKWSFIRALILSNNPSLSLEKWSAPSKVPRIARADLLEITLSEDLAPGKTVRVNLSIRNHSNFSWKRGDLFLVSGSSDWEKLGQRYQGQIEWRAVIDKDVPVWSVWTASNLEFAVPEVYDDKFDVKLNLGFRLPYQEGEGQWVSRQISGNHATNGTPSEQTKGPEIQSVEATPSVSPQPRPVIETASQTAPSPPTQRPAPPPPAPPLAPLDLAPQVVIMRQRY